MKIITKIEISKLFTNNKSFLGYFYKFVCYINKKKIMAKILIKIKI